MGHARRRGRGAGRDRRADGELVGWPKLVEMLSEGLVLLQKEEVLL